MSKKEAQKNQLRGSLGGALTAAEKEAQLEKLLGKTAAAAPPPPDPSPAKTAKKTVAEPEPENDAALEKHRVTLDLSKPLAQKVKIEATRRDQTLKGFIVELLNRYFDEKERK